MNAISLSIFFPAHNEEANIRETLERTLAATRSIQERRQSLRDYEIIVVNDGSSDNTKRIVESVAKENRHVRLINLRKNRGYGTALRTGIMGAKQDYIFFTDADLQFDVRELEKLLQHVETSDVVIGYRAPRKDPFLRLVFARGWNILNRLMFGLKVRDIDCAFKLFRRDMVQNLNLSSRGAMISAEMLIRLQRSGARITEVPVTHLPRTRGSATGAKPSVILRAFREMIRLYRGELGTVTHKEALKFMSVGVVNTLVDVSAYILLTRSVTLVAGSLITAKFLSFLAGTLTSFALNRYWTFGLRSRIRATELLKFYTVVSLALLINTASMYVFVSLGLYDLLAVLCATTITFAFNFTLSKIWVFSARRDDSLGHESRVGAGLS